MKSFNTMKVSSIYVILSFNLLGFCKLNGEGNICGRPLGSNKPEEKIVAGYDVGYYKYPWYAALMVSDIVACGGALVSTKVVVSAAHCYKEYITGANKEKLEDVYNVSLGIYNRCVKEKTHKLFFVHKVHVHEKYKENIPYYDISLLILKESASAYQPICLPKAVIKKRPREGSVPGLGTLRYHGSTPCTLHEARLLVYADADCKKMINRTGNNPSKLSRAFCAGYLQGGIDTCQGDSGGPFQITDEYGNYILQGVVSFGFHCANPNLLGVYTDVSQYLDWVEGKGGFTASMEGSHNSTPGTVSDVEVTTEHDHKTTKKHHQAHGIQEIVVKPPVSIIIIKQEERRNKRKKTVQKKSKNKNKGNTKSKNKNKGNTKSKKKPQNLH